MVDFQVGQTVVFDKATTGTNAGGWYGTKGFRKGNSATVTRVNANRITVRTTYNGEERSYNVDRVALETPNGEVWEPKASTTRKIGEVPEGGIAPDDPRLQWLWEDGERLAKNYGLCYDYDRLADRLGIPGRLRDIVVTSKVNGISLTATVKARSQKEAKALLLEKVGVAV